LTTQALALARDEFLSTHRPKLRIKHLWFASADGAAFTDEPIKSGVPLVVRIDAVNVGSAVANITFINYSTLILPLGERLPQRPPYDAPDAPRFPVSPTHSLRSGITFTAPISDGRVLTSEEHRQIRNGDSRLWFVGTIEYWDNAFPAHLRQSAFCRYLAFTRRPASDADAGRFEIEKDPDYEYED